MNEKLINRCSIRKYKKTALNSLIINEIIQIINSSPTSSNAHQFSACIVDNESLKIKLAKACFNQEHIVDASLLIVFNLDITGIKKTFANLKQTIDDKFKLNMIITSLNDLSIAATMVQDYCLLNDLGTCFIGAIRWDIKTVQTILNLPKDVIPILAITVGVKNQENTFKPKLNKVFFNNSYSSKELIDRLDNYDLTMDHYYQSKYPNKVSEAYYQHNLRTYDKDYKRNNEIDFETINKLFDLVFSK